MTKPSDLAQDPKVREALKALCIALDELGRVQWTPKANYRQSAQWEVTRTEEALVAAIASATLDRVAEQLEQHGEGKRGWPVGAVRYAADFVRKLKQETTR